MLLKFKLKNKQDWLHYIFNMLQNNLYVKGPTSNRWVLAKAIGKRFIWNE